MRNNLDSMLILDVKHIDTIRFVSTYPYAEQTILNNNKNGTGNTTTIADDSDTSTGLSQGTIIGISISCAAVVKKIVIELFQLIKYYSFE